MKTIILLNPIAFFIYLFLGFISLSYGQMEGASTTYTTYFVASDGSKSEYKIVYDGMRLTSVSSLNTKTKKFTKTTILSHDKDNSGVCTYVVKSGISGRTYTLVHNPNNQYLSETTPEGDIYKYSTVYRNIYSAKDGSKYQIERKNYKAISISTWAIGSKKWVKTTIIKENDGSGAWEYYTVKSNISGTTYKLEYDNVSNELTEVSPNGKRTHYSPPMMKGY